MPEYTAASLMKQYRHYETPQYSQQLQTWRNNIVDFERGMWLGRTPFRWFLIFVFFTTFYIGVALLVTINYLIFSYYLPTKQPRWVLEQPGLSVHPAFQKDGAIKIQYISTIYADIDKIVDHIAAEHDRYGEPPKEYYKQCGIANSYGYHSRRPCFFLKVNKVIKYNPITYTDVKEMPSCTPKYLINYIKNRKSSDRQRKVWLGCSPEPHIELQYIPHPFVNAADLIYHSSVRYFDNGTKDINDENQKTFFDNSDFSRIIAVRPVKDLKWNQRYKIRCFVFAKNIIIDTDSKMFRGTIRFEIKVINPD